MESNLLDKIKLDKFYQAGAIFSFIALLLTLTIEVKLLDNLIVALFSLSLFFFFIGYWASIRIQHSFQDWDKKSEYYKITKTAKTSYIISLIFFLLSIYQTYLFLTR